MPLSELLGGRRCERVRAYASTLFRETPDAMAALGYDSAMILADAIKRAGSTEGPKLRDALAATANYEGVTGKTTLDQNRNATKPAVVLAFKEGTYKYVETINP